MTDTSEDVVWKEANILGAPAEKLSLIGQPLSVHFDSYPPSEVKIKPPQIGEFSEEEVYVLLCDSTQLKVRLSCGPSGSVWLGTVVDTHET